MKPLCASERNRCNPHPTKDGDYSGFAFSEQTLQTAIWQFVYAVADITGVCYALYLLKPDFIAVSPIHVGCGQVWCAHGLVPVPASATVHLLEGIPCYGGQVRGELCTPTGAALLAHFGQMFGSMPLMRTKTVGYGIGKREFPAANCVRAFWGEADESDLQCGRC